MAVKKDKNDEKSKVKKTTRSKPKGKSFVVKKTIRIGSNTDGSPKENYVTGKTITLFSSEQINRLKNLKII